VRGNAPRRLGSRRSAGPEAWVRDLLGPHAKFTIPYHQTGASGRQLRTLTTTHHRIKTHGGWQIRQAAPPVIELWHSPIHIRLDYAA
jgi:hypothetical protein